MTRKIGDKVKGTSLLNLQEGISSLINYNQLTHFVLISFILFLLFLDVHHYGIELTLKIKCRYFNCISPILSKV